MSGLEGMVPIISPFMFAMVAAWYKKPSNVKVEEEMATTEKEGQAVDAQTKNWGGENQMMETGHGDCIEDYLENDESVEVIFEEDRLCSPC
mmetsp:Transcript_13764/g.19843  ORF Transcript_13764/g.19843 Transcript_13764/m.19843 type:complete len:91 (-) Transcript_13764:167-439(-)|eukprot:CAMPEP_0202448648 /NCGR_PEP_ID=MMETSP1360-20130828/7453_1 /ASSEMBLY_ACC=CAM_ASM_000848 /TAXON_ID=515479 /ORGANISM="Licmophora paradoxa, Strain CCMP2313" /LENGTH=90 /DNA_ID=CAMNT_0049066323 /DNA_START=142 /DNA_END=414 /DNA_ORIENTATION=+